MVANTDRVTAMVMSTILKCVKRLMFSDSRARRPSKPNAVRARPNRPPTKPITPASIRHWLKIARAIGAEGAAHTDVGGTPHDLRQHQAHGIQQAHQQKAE